MKKIRFENSQEISGYLSIIFILVLSALVAWFTVSTGEEIVNSARQSESFNSHKLKDGLKPEIQTQIKK